jgi:hypothetical protein
VSFSAIETSYNGTVFRSRLEARWAAFFDLVGWRWDYEPVDCNGWIPDFSLIAKGSPGGILLVEIKPIFEFSRGVADKIDAAEKEHEVLMLGCGPQDGRNGERAKLAGWLRDQDSWEWERAYFHESGGVGVHPENMGWTNRITGEYDGNCGAFADVHADRIWAEAGNIVRWSPR